VPDGSVEAFLADHRHELFPDELFADLFPSHRGRPSIPADVVATVMVLQALEGLSDREAARALLDRISWKVAAGLALDDAGFDYSVLTYWRTRLRRSDRPERIFDAVREVIDATGVLRGRTRRALDSTPLDDAVATQDTVTQLISAMRRVRRLVPAAAAVALVGGHQVAHIRPDPERAPLITLAFEAYATGEWTLDKLAAELAHRGLRNRGRADRAAGPIGVSALADILANKAYAGIVCWGGVDYPGVHEPLVSAATFQRVGELLGARSVRGTRERRHHHYLKGSLWCGVCGRRLSLQRSKGRYTYFYCLGQKDRRYPTGCREAYVPAESLEAQVEELYRGVELPPAWLEGLHEALEAEISARQQRSTVERALLARRLERAEGERRKLLDAYYAGAVDVAVLKAEQTRIGGEMHAVEQRIAALDTNLAEWREILGTAARFATNCAVAYVHASDKTRRLLNNAVFRRLVVRDGRVAEMEYQEPFDVLFGSTEFEYGVSRFGTRVSNWLR
jgi:hypothetical protein